MKTRIDVECTCLTCCMHFTINDFLMHFDMKTPNSGFFLSGLSCPNCELDGLIFDFIVTEERYPIKKLVEHRKKYRKDKRIVKT